MKEESSQFAILGPKNLFKTVDCFVELTHTGCEIMI